MTTSYWKQIRLKMLSAVTFTADIYICIFQLIPFYFVILFKFQVTHLHELGRVESEGEDRHRDDVDHQPLGVAHRLKI